MASIPAVEILPEVEKCKAFLFTIFFKTIYKFSF